MRKIVVRSISWILCIVFCMVLAQPMIVSAAEKEEITVMTNIADEVMSPYIAVFERKYPNISIKHYTYSDYESAMKSHFEAGTMGDVVLIPNCCAPQQYSWYFVNLGSVDELSEKYNFIEDGKHYMGKVYGIPTSAHVTGILYNKEVFDKAGITDAPKTIDEFLQDLQMIKERTDAIPFYTNYAADWTLQYWEGFTYLEMTGNPDYKNNDFLYYRNPFSQGTAHYKVYKLLYDIVSEGLCEENPKESDWVLCKEMLNKGEIGCIAIGSWAIQQFMLAGENGDSVAFMPFPNNINGKQYMTVFPDYTYAINVKSEHKEAARAFIDFMLDESGYALDNQAFSIVKSDPYPDAFGDMRNVVLLTNSQAEGNNNSRKNMLYTKLNLGDNEHVARVINAAAGYSDESFDEIMDDWNELWESCRPDNMESELLENETIESETIESERFSGLIAGEYEVALSDTEKAFVEECGIVKVGYLKNLAPFQYEGENGFEGLSRELCDGVFDKVGIQFEYVGFDNSAELLEALQNNSIHMAAGIEVRTDMSDTLRFSRKYMEYMKVVAKNDTTDVDNLDEKCEACVTGSEYSQKQDEQHVKCIKVNTVSEAISAVDNGIADFMVENYYSVDYYVKQMGCEHVSVVPMSENGSLAFAFPIGVDTRLISICNKCLYAIPDGLIQMSLMEYLDPPAKDVTLARFIEANPLLFCGIVFGVLLIIVLAAYAVLRQRWLNGKAHLMEMRRYEILAALMDEYVFDYDIEKKRLHLDDKSQKQFGVEGDIFEDDYSQDNACVNVLLEELKNAQKEEGQYTSKPIEIKMHNGNPEWYRFVIYTLTDTNNADTHMIGKIVNAQKEVEEQRRMLDRASRDPLTNFYNREGFEKCYNWITVKESFAYAVVDLDDFKTVNDELGHDGGDRALLLLVENMQKVFDENTVFCRYGGDEFVFCVYDMPRKRVEQCMEQLVKAMDCRMDYLGKNKKLSISMGAVFADRKLPQEIAFRLADEVLYRVKEHGKNNWCMEDITGASDYVKEGDMV